MKRTSVRLSKQTCLIRTPFRIAKSSLSKDETKNRLASSRMTREANSRDIGLARSRPSEVRSFRQSQSTGVMGVCQNATVRRLLPVECERLMGFPDNHTRIPWKGKPEDECPDAPRYKACGNSMCVNVMAWIGHRIEEAEKYFASYSNLNKENYVGNN